jgi:hypothetical protein
MQITFIPPAPLFIDNGSESGEEEEGESGGEM